MLLDRDENDNDVCVLRFMDNPKMLCSDQDVVVGCGSRASALTGDRKPVEDCEDDVLDSGEPDPVPMLDCVETDEKLVSGDGIEDAAEVVPLEAAAVVALPFFVVEAGAIARRRVCAMARAMP
ncbi:hypothetical protein GGF38_000694 [Coemansia sp. RSA 25]|nr:hypothetical protein GGF38_000694 [Coemansia sp. RSA 25]